jgi:lipoteichoic acid synthase
LGSSVLKLSNHLRIPLSRREGFYLLSLLVPFFVYDLALKAVVVLWERADYGLLGVLPAIWSDVFFVLGYALFWIGLYAVVRRGPLSWAVLVLFHVTMMLIMIVNACAYQYFEVTGTMLDYFTLAEWIPRFDEIQPILFQEEGSLSVWLILSFALFYTTFGPLVVTNAVGRWRGWSREPSPDETAETTYWSLLGHFLLAVGFVSLSLLVGSRPAGGASIAGDPFLNVILMGVKETATGGDALDAAPVSKPPATDASLSETPQVQKRNVVLIHLESTREESVTPYNEDLQTTPFLDELAKSSLLAERAYVVLPRSSKGSVSVNCGIEPALYPGPEFVSGDLPAPCLAGPLKGQGYRTVFFQSNSNAADNFGDVVKNMGYEEFYPTESMDTEGFQVTNTFGYEDDIMLKPSEEWLRAHEDEPFMAEYLTSTGHYGYECVPNRYGTENFSEDDQLNRYLNCLHYLDSFVKNLMDQYKELGLYDNTIFVLFGDHGEGFGEHGRFMHGDTPYEEGLRIPLIIHAPGRFENGERAEGLSSQIDILPTVLDLLGYEVENGEYPGFSLLHELPEDRTLRFSCISNRECLASIKGHQKYIYHYGKQPDEVFNLSTDPLETRNLASVFSKEALDERREDLLRWRSQVNAGYGDILINGTLLYQGESP